MPLFGRKSSPVASSRSQELEALRRSIQNRGQAQIPEAIAKVDQFVTSVLRLSGIADTVSSRSWVGDRLQFFLVSAPSPQWFGLLAELPECSELQAEFNALVRNRAFGPGHVVAWWWLLQPSLFEPLVDSQFQQMTEPLVEGVRAAEAKSFASGTFVDWDECFAST
jgi:mannose/cellobiose epimerase-like protein (N-acyl-D-glucosamine 2-epimerase family)